MIYEIRDNSVGDSIILARFSSMEGAEEYFTKLLDEAKENMRKSKLQFEDSAESYYGLARDVFITPVEGDLNEEEKEREAENSKDSNNS